VAAVDSSITKINASKCYTFRYYHNVTGNIGMMKLAGDSTIFIPTRVHTAESPAAKASLFFSFVNRQSEKKRRNI